MEKYLVFDVETTGLFDFSKPADHPEQPRLAHLNCIYADGEGNKVAQHDFLIKPDETWTAQNFADLESPSNPNPLTREILERDGVPLADALAEYSGAIQRGLIATAYNAQFDCKVMRSELRRSGMDDLFSQTKNICVMRPMTGVCKIPNKNRGGFKFPSLTEALEHLSIKLTNAHSADADTEGARVVLQWLIRAKLLPEAKVHHAKEGSKSSKALAGRQGNYETKPIPASKSSGSDVPNSF